VLDRTGLSTRVGHENFFYSDQAALLALADRFATGAPPGAAPAEST